MTLLVGLLPAAAQQYRTYVNDRFGASALIPTDYEPQSPPENGDGRSFISKDGTARITVYSSYAPSTVAGNFAGYRLWLIGDEEQQYPISYKAAGDSWFVFSGTQGDQIIYTRVIAGCRDMSVAHHIRLKYPAAQKKAFDALVTQVAGSLRQKHNGACPAETAP